MNVTHLDCGSMREVPADGRPAARVVCHCLVVEADHGLVLVETGFGAVDGHGRRSRSDRSSSPAPSRCSTRRRPRPRGTTPPASPTSC